MPATNQIIETLCAAGTSVFRGGGIVPWPLPLPLPLRPEKFREFWSF